jgi:uncharacterized protein
MRNFPLLLLIVFVIEYILVGIISYFNLKKIPRLYTKKNKVCFYYIYISYSFLILVIFIILYLSPFGLSHPANYPYYMLFNVILVTDILSKNIIALFSVPYFIFRILGRKKISFLYAGIILSFCMTFSLLFGMLQGKSQLHINKIELKFPSLPKSFDGFSIAQISDIHIGSFYNQYFLKKTSKKLNGLNADLLVFTGDLVNNYASETVGLQPLFLSIKAKQGKYAILGNHDYGDYSKWNSKLEKEENFNAIIKAYNNFGFHLLRNESVRLSNQKDSIYLIGVENWGQRPFPQYADLSLALKDTPSESFKILMTHDPSHWENNVEGKENIALTLSGHTHGLQWGLKPAGIEFSLMYFLRKKWAGLYENNGQYLYVNRGLGRIGVNFRLDMPAEITLITLKTK